MFKYRVGLGETLFYPEEDQVMHSKKCRGHSNHALKILEMYQFIMHHLVPNIFLSA